MIPNWMSALFVIGTIIGVGIYWTRKEGFIGLAALITLFVILLVLGSIFA